MIKAIRSRLEAEYLDGRGYSSGKAFSRRLLDSVPAGGVLLDAGCGEAKLRRQLGAKRQYVGLDRYLGGTASHYQGWRHAPDAVADVVRLPIRSRSVDSVVLLYVLEHVRDPAAVLRDIARVLKPGGSLFLAAPFVHKVHHAPEDYFRFTAYGLETLLVQAGFEKPEIRPTGGYYRALHEFLGEHRRIVANLGCLAQAAVLPWTTAIAVLEILVRLPEYALDLLSGDTSLVAGYAVIARTPAGREGQG